MRLKYKILWVDDHKEDFVNLDIHQEISEYVKSLFLDVELLFCETVDEAKSYISSQIFDVIFSDYNIGEKDKGDNFISYLRSNHVNTEVLFYSAQEKVPGLDVDRVSFFSIPKVDNAYEVLVERMKKLIDLTIEKLQDLTVIRGLVMAETSDLDKIMEDIINHYFVINRTDETDVVFNSIMEKFNDDYKNNLRTDVGSSCIKDCYHKITKSMIPQIITSLNFDSARKARAIKRIIELINFTHDRVGENYYETYRQEIIQERNNLAHSISKIVNKEEVIVLKKVDAEGNHIEINYDPEKFKTIRENIIIHLDILTKLKMIICR